MRVRESERRAWEEDGFFLRRSVFSEAELAELRRAAERVAAQTGSAAADAPGGYEVDGNRYQPAAGSLVQYEHAEGSRTLRVVEPFHHLDPVFDALVDDPRLVQPIADLVGCERVSLWTDKINLKRPREGSRFDWHQDSPYWNHACDHVDRLPNVMVSLDDASVANGCFRIVRGSHRRGILPGREGQGTLGPLFTHPDHFELADQVAIEAPAGTLVFFSPHSVHGSEPNRSDEPRRALVLTYQPAGHEMFKIPRERLAGGPAWVAQASRPAALANSARSSS